MDMQWPPSRCKAKNETTRTVLIVRIIFNNFALAGNCLLHFSHTNFPDDALINSMFGELKFTPLEFGLNFMYL